MSAEQMEALTSHASPVELGSDRSFGIVFAALFLVVGVLPLFTDGSARIWALFLSAAFLITAAARPRLLSPLNRAWGSFGMRLNPVVSPISSYIAQRSYKEIWVQPAAGDAGGALGAALSTWHGMLGHKRTDLSSKDAMQGSYLPGPEFFQTHINTRLRAIGAKFDVLRDEA